ncbi:hypothetical protein GCM10029978_045390 [Actinoallomurus acanthiterrae]
MSNVPEPLGLTRRRFLGAAMAATGALALTTIDFGAARPVRAATYPKGLDSNQDPDPGQIAAAGYTFLSYYLTGPGSMTAAKVAACAAHGVAVIANFEQLADPTGRGHSGGQSDAQTALAAANACGIPGDRPIYFSLDYDVQPSGFAAVDAYLDGIASVLPPSRIGVYSSTWCIDHLAGNGKASWFWQSMSGGFSGGQNATLNPHTHIWQRGYYTTPGGASCEWDYAITTDYGQWGTHRPQSAAPLWDSSWSVFNPVSGTTTVFGRGLDGSIGFSQNSGGGWSKWVEVNPYWKFAGDPRAVFNTATNTTMVFGRGTDGSIGVSENSGGGWSKWAEVNPYWKFAGDPTVVTSPTSNYTIVFARGNDGSIGFSQNSGGGWSKWAEVNPYWKFAGDPRAVFNTATNTTMVFGRGTDGSIGVSENSGGGWSKWAEVNPYWKFAGDPTVVTSPTSDYTVVFARGNDGSIGFSQNSGGGWSKWAEVNPYWKFAGDPRAVFNTATNTTMVFGRGTDGSIGVSMNSGGGWSKWAEVNPYWKFAGDPTVVTSPTSDYTVVFARGNDGSIGFSQNSGGGWSKWVEVNPYWKFAGP